MTDADFHADLCRNVAARAAASADFTVAAFADIVCEALTDAGAIQEFQPLSFRNPSGNMRLEGYGFGDEGLTLDLHLADFDGGTEIETLSRADMEVCFRRLERFLVDAVKSAFLDAVDVGHPVWGFARQLSERIGSISRVRLNLLTDRKLSGAVKEIPSAQRDDYELQYRVWDLAAIQRLLTSDEADAIEVDLVEMFGRPLPCLAANAGSDDATSYLAVIPGDWLAAIYDRWSGRLLEQNVRTFLQAKGKVNRGIRRTILDEPNMFFAYNNGISATASKAEFDDTDGALALRKLHHLQIVNGGQTTASIFNVAKKDKSLNLDRVFVQMKLSVIKPEHVDRLVPLISQYANSQNKVSDADFFSNHPFHVRIEGISRRVWAPAPDGSTVQTRWFYERARGQYANATAWSTPARKREFEHQNPRTQLITKTDLAKVIMTLRQEPSTVCHGSQKNFLRFAEHVGESWKEDGVDYGDAWFRMAVAGTIMFRTLERLVQKADWYSQGYRAQIVTYVIALLQFHLARSGQELDFERLWQRQAASSTLTSALLSVGELVNHRIVAAASSYGVANVTEWCKRDRCWEDLKTHVATGAFDKLDADLTSKDAGSSGRRSARKDQKVTNEIDAQSEVVSLGTAHWKTLLKWAEAGTVMTPSEVKVLGVAAKMPHMIPSGPQAIKLLQIAQKAAMEGWKP